MALSFSPSTCALFHKYPLQSSTNFFTSNSVPITITPRSLPSIPQNPKPYSLQINFNPHNNPLQVPSLLKWRTRVSFFSSFLTKIKDSESLKEELLQTIAPLDRGAEATPESQELVDQIARKLEAINKVKEPLKSNLLNGKWELLYTTSKSILQPQATANLVPLNARRVAVKFDAFRIAGLIPIKSRGSGRGQLEITYLDEELRISRGNEGNLFILKMVDPSYRVPL